MLSHSADSRRGRRVFLLFQQRYSNPLRLARDSNSIHLLIQLGLLKSTVCTPSSSPLNFYKVLCFKMQ